MIQLRHRQPSLWHSGLAKDIEDLWEPWMEEVDQLLEDAALLESVYDAQGKRHPKSRPHGRTQTPAEVALRLLILKHVRTWSYDTLEREVRANLVYRAFTRIGDEKVPHAKTLARLGQAIGPEVIGELHDRLMELARERGVVQGRKMRIDTTVVETNVHYPTDSSLLGDGARVLTRTMKKVEKATGGLKTRIRNRMRSVVRQTKARVFRRSCRLRLQETDSGIGVGIKDKSRAGTHRIKHRNRRAADRFGGTGFFDESLVAGMSPVRGR